MTQTEIVQLTGVEIVDAVRSCSRRINSCSVLARLGWHWVVGLWERPCLLTFMLTDSTGPVQHWSLNVCVLNTDFPNELVLKRVGVVLVFIGGLWCCLMYFIDCRVSYDFYLDFAILSCRYLISLHSCTPTFWKSMPLLCILGGNIHLTHSSAMRNAWFCRMNIHKLC